MSAASLMTATKQSTWGPSSWLVWHIHLCSELTTQKQPWCNPRMISCQQHFSNTHAGNICLLLFGKWSGEGSQCIWDVNLTWVDSLCASHMGSQLMKPDKMQSRHYRIRNHCGWIVECKNLALKWWGSSSAVITPFANELFWDQQSCHINSVPSTQSLMIMRMHGYRPFWGRIHISATLAVEASCME